MHWPAAWPHRKTLRFFITPIDREGLRHQAAALVALAPEPNSLPLWGIPFAVKDNIDVAALPTTAACPAFAYTPDEDAFVVGRLKAAGAIVIGKTNLDQFATGLNGTRSPYGAPRCVFDASYISGGSSSGSAVCVAAGLATFAPWHRHSRIGTGSRRIQQYRRDQTNPWPVEHTWPGPRLPEPRCHLCFHELRRRRHRDPAPRGM